MIAPTPPASPASPLAAALLHARREARGGVVLRIEEPAPHRRRVARALLQEGALAAGGQVLEGPAGDLLLVGAEPRRAERLRGLVERLVGPEAIRILSLERDGAALLAYAEGGAPPEPAEPGPDLAGLDDWLEALPLEPVLSRRLGRSEGMARPAFLRLAPDRGALARRLGPLGADADLLDHAVARLARRLLAALAAPETARPLLAGHRPARLHLTLPEAAIAQSAPPGLVATMPASALAEPGRIAALAAAGIGLELDGLEAALPLLDPAALPPGAFLRLRRDPGPVLERLDPTLLVLAEEAAPLIARAPCALLEVAA